MRKTQTRFDFLGKSPNGPASRDNSYRTRQELARQYLFESDAPGGPYLCAGFPSLRTPEPQIVNLSFLLSFPNLTMPVSEAYALLFCDKSTSTRRSRALSLAEGFFTFLWENGMFDLQLRGLRRQLFVDFSAWLNRVDSSSGVAVWKFATRSQHWGSICLVINHLRRNKPWETEIDPSLYLPEFASTVEARPGTHKGVLTADELQRIHKACLIEVTTWIGRMKSIIPIGTVQESTLVNQASGNSEDVLLPFRKILVGAYRDRVPKCSEVCRDFPELKDAAVKAYGEGAVTRSFFFPGPRDLVPFVLLLAIFSRLNAETLLSLDLNSISTIERMGQRVLQLRCYKPRSQREQLATIPVDSTPDNPAVLLEFLKEWTAKARRLAPDHLQNLLFLWVGQTRSVVSTFSQLNESGGSLWKVALDRFRAQHNLPRFTLDMIRPTVNDIGNNYFGDLRASQVLLDHRSLETTFSNYTSDGQRQRNAERLGEAMQVRTTWRQTEGVIDARDRPAGSDVAAATPGWSCLDPYSSPHSKKGRLCEAYGQCPVCPLAQINLRSAYSCAQAYNLLDSVRRAKLTMAPKAYLVRLLPVEEKLVSHWLPRFSPDVIASAQKLAGLPPLPNPE